MDEAEQKAQEKVLLKAKDDDLWFVPGVWAPRQTR